jgi:hypothetical protein
VKIYDGHFPEEFLDLYLEYYRMTREQFNEVIDRWVNQDLFEKVDGMWVPTFEIK